MSDNANKGNSPVVTLVKIAAAIISGAASVTNYAPTTPPEKKIEHHVQLQTKVDQIQRNERKQADQNKRNDTPTTAK